MLSRSRKLVCIDTKVLLVQFSSLDQLHTAVVTGCEWEMMILQAGAHIIQLTKRYNACGFLRLELKVPEQRDSLFEDKFWYCTHTLTSKLAIDIAKIKSQLLSGFYTKLVLTASCSVPEPENNVVYLRRFQT